MRIPRRAVPALLAAMALAAAALAGCSAPSSNTTEHDAANAGINLLLQNQPVPIFPTSELRENMVEIEAIQALGAPTTSFFFPPGSVSVVGGKQVFTSPPFKICPSQGEPIHADDSLTNPQQALPGSAGAVVSQMDPNGTYAGPNSGTYVLCLTKAGTKKMAYWEGDVFTESGTAVWNPDGGPGDQIQDVGPSALPVCVKKTAQDGDGLNLKAGTEYFHCELAK